MAPIMIPLIATDQRAAPQEALPASASQESGNIFSAILNEAAESAMDHRGFTPDPTQLPEDAWRMVSERGFLGYLLYVLTGQGQETQGDLTGEGGETEETSESVQTVGEAENPGQVNGLMDEIDENAWHGLPDHEGDDLDQAELLMSFLMLLSQNQANQGGGTDPGQAPGQETMALGLPPESGPDPEAFSQPAATQPPDRPEPGQGGFLSELNRSTPPPDPSTTHTAVKTSNGGEIAAEPTSETQGTISTSVDPAMEIVLPKARFELASNGAMKEVTPGSRNTNQVMPPEEGHLLREVPTEARATEPVVPEPVSAATAQATQGEAVQAAGPRLPREDGSPGIQAPQRGKSLSGPLAHDRPQGPTTDGDINRPQPALHTAVEHGGDAHPGRSLQYQRGEMAMTQHNAGQPAAPGEHQGNGGQFTLVTHGNVEGPRPGTSPVGQGPSTILEQTQLAQDVMNQIRSGLAANLRLRNNRAVIQLHPPELGRVRVELLVHHNNHVQASFTAEHQEVRHLIEGQMQLLREQLASSGFSLGQCSVDVSGQQGSGLAGGFTGQGNSTGEQEGFSSVLASGTEEGREVQMVQEPGAGISASGLNLFV